MSGPATPVFRFAPSPNGRLHLGHAYSALLNADLAVRTIGRLLLRIEDIDPVRSRPELIEAILSDLAWLGLRFAAPVRRQSRHMETYRAKLGALAARGLAYPCFCSRSAIRARTATTSGSAAVDPDGTPLYPGTCRQMPEAERATRLAGGKPHGWRLDMARAVSAAPGAYAYRAFDPDFEERSVSADPVRWGDAMIGRRDGATSYHLAVVLDDAEQGVTHVVRGLDLEAATDLHVLLQRLFGLPSPRYHHHGLIRDANGEKLAKSRGSIALADLRAQGTSPAEIRARLGFS
ncbi:tRNA glutamyl-Q(34) synthetase GluQRS [Methylobacterium trifolii]|uniref:Glutamate--tRNA ligase n=1 Tax=Methylobacterium trifolii TaxID=1003092 RepID=A0ABQ4U250_9HYPH|nr:tRNA glutamyl-Q(34) synthetase GluQRS [Methylobacterium trifolii]GJE60831.1 Glutamate--tRNA ligase [Methylobacterium trifolii]